MNISYAVYEALPGVRWSDLKHMAKSPAHYLAHLEGEPVDSPAMLFGRACHCAVLEPVHLPEQFVVFDGARRGGVWTEFRDANAGKDILTRDEWDRVLGVQAAVTAHPVASKLLAGKGQNEVTITWRDTETDIACKSRLDRLILPNGNGLGVIVDFKTTADLDLRRFVRTVSELKYVSQLGMYRDGVQAMFDRECRAVIIAAETKPPFDCGVFAVSSDDLWSGSDEFHALLSRLAECSESGEWPGRYPERVSLDLPPWAFGEADETDEIEVLS